MSKTCKSCKREINVKESSMGHIGSEPKHCPECLDEMRGQELEDTHSRLKKRRDRDEKVFYFK